jgi:hypothetical protein
MGLALFSKLALFTMLLALPLSGLGMPDAIFFDSPRDAVPALAKLLAGEDWAGLARCYSLEGSGIDRRELETGRYFRRASVAEGHPAGLDRWRHPFPPGYRYLSHTVDGDGALVQVGIEIDQGAGMVQRGLREFRMRKTAGGWQVLPDRADVLVRQWAAAALRAHASRTRATLENPEAEAEADRIETLLRAEPRGPVALADRLAEVERRRGETANELDSVKEVRRLDLERELLAGLQSRWIRFEKRH